MPNKAQQDNIFGFIILGATLILVGWSVYLSFPKKGETTVINPAEIISPRIFESKEVSQLKSDDLNGPFPITVTPEEEGRENPFAGF